MTSELVINNKIHNEMCEYAKNKECNCSCGGQYHGIKRELNHDEYLDETEPIGVHMGGELAEFIKPLLEKEMICFCKKIIRCIGWLGEKDHDGGLKDKDGNFWWPYIECEYCKYKWNFAKVPRRVKMLEEERKHG